ncbi:helix-turn-helix domain-containing protein [Salmonella enterica]
MSRTATDWAWKLTIKPASLKLLLLSMADRADEEHCCFPSIARLVRDTSLDKKTIQKGFGELTDMGVITDTGERKGSTKRVKVWRLRVEIDEILNEPKNGNIPENGYMNDPKNGKMNDPVFGIQNQSFNQNNTTTGEGGFLSSAAARRLGVGNVQPFPMPPLFSPTEKHALIARERKLDLDDEFAKFGDFCKSTGKCYVDWGAALSLWLRNARPDPRKAASASRPAIDLDNTDWAGDLKL